jgi:Zn-dependent protease
VNGSPIARLFGFEIRVHLSWAIVLAVIIVTVAAEVGAVEPTVAPPIRWLVGGVVALLFLGSAVLHELGHAVVARRSGMPVGPIVVFFFGGAATPDEGALRARDEVAAAVAGPLVSLVIGVVLVGAAGLAASIGTEATLAAGQLILMVGLLNLVLGAINLVPAYPLDGGRLVRGLAWMRTGDPRRATRIAAAAGRAIGWVLVALGMAVILTADTIDGLMLGLCGWFLTSAARQVDRRALVDDLLDGLRVDEVMDRDVHGLPPGLTIDAFAGQMLDGSASSSLPVVRGTEFLGVIGAGQLRRLKRGVWPQTRAEDVMVAAASLPSLGPETPLRTAFDDLRRTGLDGLAVIGTDGLAGIVTRRAVIEALHSRARLRGVVLP